MNISVLHQGFDIDLLLLQVDLTKIVKCVFDDSLWMWLQQKAAEVAESKYQPYLTIIWTAVSSVKSCHIAVPLIAPSIPVEERRDEELAQGTDQPLWNVYENNWPIPQNLEDDYATYRSSVLSKCS